MNNDINTTLVRETGRAIIQRLTDDQGAFRLELIDDDKRQEILRRAQTLVETERAGMNANEKKALQLYVQDAILGTADPDQRLFLTASQQESESGARLDYTPHFASRFSPKLDHVAHPAQSFRPRSSASSAGNVTGKAIAPALSWFLKSLLPTSRRTIVQKIFATFFFACMFFWLSICLVLWYGKCSSQGIVLGTIASFGCIVASFIPGFFLYSEINCLFRLQRWKKHPELLHADMEVLRNKLEHAPKSLSEARSIGRAAGAFVALSFILAGVLINMLNGPTEGTRRRFTNVLPVNLKRNPEIDYDIYLGRQWYRVYVPPAYNGKAPFGLIVYTGPTDDTFVPAGWSKVLDKRNFIFIAPQDAGNGREQKTRDGLNVLGALSALNTYNIDRSRVYAAGLSGGARTAGDLGFYQSDLFKGTIQDCGADFIRPVTHSPGSTWVDTNGNPYGVLEVSKEDSKLAREKVGFVLITGPKDFRHGNILDLYNGGFKKGGFNCKLLDVDGMGHEDCSGATLNEALNFLTGETVEIPAETKSTPVK